MNARGWLAGGALAGSLIVASPAQAQRSGFIIDLGLGLGMVSSSWTVGDYGISDRASKAGVAMDFHIGRVIGSSLELYLVQYQVFVATRAQKMYPGELAAANHGATSLTGVGVTYPLNTALSVKAAVGLADESLYESLFRQSLGVWHGLGFLAGGRYGLRDRWALDLDLMYGGWNSGGSPSEKGSAWGAAVTINWLSH